jgi:hypothetical protein
MRNTVPGRETAVSPRHPGYNRPSLREFSPLRRLRPAAILPLLLVSACSQAPAAVSGSPSSAPSATASATPSAAGYRLLVTSSTATATEIFLYDSASSAPQQLVTLGAVPPPDPKFVSTQTVAYIDGSNHAATKIVNLDLSSHASNTVVTVNGNVMAFAYSHDGTTLAYLLHDDAGKASLHVRRSGRESMVNLNPIPGRGVGRDDELRLEYAPDDKYLLMVDTFVGNQGQAPESGQFLVLRANDNTVAFVPPSGVSANATMAAWARHSDRLYYRDQVGVRTWDGGSTSVGTLASGLHWYDPAPAPDDRAIAYTDIDTAFTPHVKTYDLARGQPAATSSSPRSHPIFITADTIWYLEEQPCQSECLGGPSQASGKVFAYNLKTRSETALPFSDVRSLSQLAVFSR